LPKGVYTSPFPDWSRNAAVCGNLNPHYAMEANTVPFSRNLLPVLKFTPKDPKMEERLLFAGLDYYFSKTNFLEIKLIAPCASYISKGGLRRLLRLGRTDGIPLQMELDAYRLTVDEDFHAFAEETVVRQAAETLNIERHEQMIESPTYLEAYEHDMQTVNAEEGRLLQIGAACVTEMCLSKTLCLLPK